jgi:hypothetical protein
MDAKKMLGFQNQNQKKPEETEASKLKVITIHAK